MRKKRGYSNRLSFSKRRKVSLQAVTKQNLPSTKVGNRRVPVLSSKLLNRKSTALKSYRAGLAIAAVPSLTGSRNPDRKLNQVTQTSLAGKAPSRDSSRKSRAQQLVQRTPPIFVKERSDATKKEERSDDQKQKDTTFKLRLRGVGYDDHVCKKRPDSKKAGETSARRRASGKTRKTPQERKSQFNVWC